MISLTGKKVVVVGGAGFVGMALVRLLVALEAQVYVLDNFSRDPKKSRLVKGARYSPGNVGDDATHVSTCRTYMRGSFAVFNLAADVGGIYYNLENQLDILVRNTMLQLTPLQVASQMSVPNFLQVSSVCVYPPEVQGGVPVGETCGIYGQLQEANEGYALAKRNGEMAALMSGMEHIVVVRPSNIAGPGDYYDDKAHVIPALIKRVVDPGRFTIYGSGEVVREFIHPFDVASGMICALTAGKGGEVYNIGNPNNVVSISDVAELILKLAGSKKKAMYIEGENGDMYRSSDSSKLMALGWEPRFDIEKIVRDEVDGYVN